MVTMRSVLILVVLALLTVCGPSKEEKQQPTVASTPPVAEAPSAKEVTVRAVVSTDEGVFDREYHVPENARYLRIGGQPLNVRSVTGLEQLREIEYLYLSVIGDRDIAGLMGVLASLEGLKHLVLMRCTFAFGSQLSSFKNLESIEVVGPLSRYKGEPFQLGGLPFLRYFGFVSHWASYGEEDPYPVRLTLIGDLGQVRMFNFEDNWAIVYSSELHDTLPRGATVIVSSRLPDGFMPVADAKREFVRSYEQFKKFTNVKPVKEGETASLIPSEYTARFVDTLEGSPLFLDISR